MAPLLDGGGGKGGIEQDVAEELLLLFTLAAGAVTTVIACFPFVFTRLLDFVGLYGLLLEGYNPGVLVPGVIGAICFE